MSEKQERFYWKGKKVSFKVYKKRCQQQQIGKNIHKRMKDKSEIDNLKNDSNCKLVKAVEGRRICHIETLGKQLFCKQCDYILSLEDIIEEKRIGLAAIFYVQCRNCKIVSSVYSDKQHDVNQQNRHFDVNTKIVAGVLNAGMGNTQLNEVLCALNIPHFNWKSFKTHEKEVGKVIEEMAHESCKAAAAEERSLTIKNYEKIQPMLPLHLNKSFIFPDLPVSSNSVSITEEHRVRIAASIDMGWFTRGTGRSYNSFSGSASIIGLFSKKVISYVTLNRKCKKCDKGHDVQDHDCRLNFNGTAKAMEPYAAVQLTKNNIILTDCKVDVGIIVADNDSSSIAALRNAHDFEIVKQCDKNHTIKGVVNALYKIQKSYKELTTSSIQYLQKCFSYSISQNVGNSEAIAHAIKNIPYHSFNMHQNCGSWCSYSKNSEQYVHRNIGDGFTDHKLFDALQKLFGDLANNAEKYSVGASSNANESLNTIIVSKAPKSRMYGMSASSDIRVACAINKKNDGEIYVTKLSKKLNMSPGKHTYKHGNNTDLKNKAKYARSKTTQFKRRRLFLKQNKNLLKKKKQLLEGIMYETDSQLMKTVDVSMPIAKIKNEEPVIVFFDTETADFHKNTDILQIAAKCKNLEFSVYIRPTQTISDAASNVHGLHYINGNLQLHGKTVDDLTLHETMLSFYQFLYKLKKKCILTAHNCKFDYSRLILAIEKVFMTNHFKSLIKGFSDTLPLLKKSNSEKGKGKNKLVNLAAALKINTNDAHNAITDVRMLEEILLKYNISHQIIKDSCIEWTFIEEQELQKTKIFNELKTLKALNKCTSINIRKKLITAGISYNMIVNAYKQNKLVAVSSLLGKNEIGKIKVTINKKALKKLCDFLETLPK